MSDIFRDRHAKLGCIVLRLFPKVMQMILKYYETPPGLKQKYLKQNFRFVFTKKEIVLMDKLPNMDEFTIEICYKILRSENMLDEPKCKWGNVPHATEVEISDNIQRLINATNSILSLRSEEVTEKYFEKLLEEIKLIVTRNDTFLQQDALESMYNSVSRSETDSLSILQDLTRVKAIDEAEFLPDTESEKMERYSRLSMAVIDTFPNILRDVIRSNISASDMYSRCIKYIGKFNPEQQANLRQLQNSNTYSSLDITLIYRLLREFSLILPPTQGWGAIPDKADTNLADDIERIRFHRNQIAHRCDTNIDANVFDDYFDKFQTIGRRMDLNFFQKTNFEQRIIGHRTRRIDTEMLKRYENAMKEIENVQLRFEKRPVKFYWGKSFDECLMKLRSLIKDEKEEGRQKVRLQIMFESENDVEDTIDILNLLKDEINTDLSGIEFIVATKGSIILTVDILVEMLETDEILRLNLTLFLAKILESITSSITESIDMVLLPAEVYTQWPIPKPILEPVYVDFDIEAELFKNDDKMEEQLIKISDAILKHSNGSGREKDITATPLPVYLGSGGLGATSKPDMRPMAATHARPDSSYVATGHTEENITSTEEVLTQAQTPVNYKSPVSVTLRQKLNIKKSRNENKNIYSCIKISNALVFTDYNYNILIVCNSDGTHVHHIPLRNSSRYITVVDSITVAVSCTYERTILIINISTDSVTNKINTSGDCYGLLYDDNYIYVVIDRRIIHVMDLTGKMIRTIPVQPGNIHDITVHRDRLVSINNTSIYCCSLDGNLIWKFKNDKYQYLSRVTTDGEDNVYVTSPNTNTVVVVSDDGKDYREILTKSDGLKMPFGIYFDKKENILLVCNYRGGNAFLFDVNMKLS